MSNTAATAARPNTYQIVTDRILQRLKAGVIPWEKPWQTPQFSAGPFPRNFLSGKPYRGVNVFLLWSSPYASPFWLTFKQAVELRATVRKGEKGTHIVFYKQLRSKKEDTEASDTEKERAPFVLCYYTVFNVEQCDGLTLPQIEQPPQPNEVETDEACEAIVTGWANRPALHLTSEHEYRAHYRPRTDSVHMPARARFVDAPHYYCTLFHELIHSTGMKAASIAPSAMVSATSFTARKNWLRRWARLFFVPSPVLPTSTPTATPPLTSRTGFLNLRMTTA